MTPEKCFEGTEGGALKTPIFHPLFPRDALAAHMKCGHQSQKSHTSRSPTVPDRLFQGNGFCHSAMVAMTMARR